MIVRFALLIALILSATAARGQDVRPACPQTGIGEAEALAVLREFEGRDLDEMKDLQEAAAAFRKLHVAECSIAEWPAGLPPRAFIRKAINAGIALLRVGEARQSGNFLNASLMPSLVAIVEYLDAFERAEGEAEWIQAQLRKFELLTGDLIRELGSFLPLADRSKLYSETRAALDEALADPLIATPANRPQLLGFRARTHWSQSELLQGASIEAAAADYELATAEYLASGRRGDAFNLALETIDFALVVDKSSATAQEALRKLAEKFQPAELRRRRFYEKQVLVARRADDRPALVAASRDWFDALKADLEASRSPIWGAGPDTSLQRLFLAAPSMLPEADVVETFSRLDELAAVTRSGEFTITSPILAEVDLPRPGSAGRAERPASPDVGAAALFTQLGVDAVFMPIWAGQPLDVAGFQQVMAAGRGEQPTSDRLLWVGAVRSAGGGRTRLATIPARFDQAVLVVNELSRGLASSFPAFLRTLGAPDLSAQDLALLKASFRQAALANAASVERAFFTAFGEAIDSALGGRCAQAASVPSGKVPRILLMLPASFDIFPVHLARAANGRRLIDCYEFRRAPDLRTALRAAEARKGAGPVRAMLGLWNPNSDIALAGAERSLIVAAASRGKVDVREVASQDLGSLLRPEQTPDLVHITAHGRVGWFDPYQSGFQLGGGRMLKLIDLLSGRETTRARLVVLPACEGGLTSPSFGEVARFGIPSGFLEAGAGGVVTALWEVRDDAAALVMGRFYDLLIGSGLGPSAALREAQLWLRDQSSDQLIDYLVGKEKGLKPGNQQQLARLRTAVLQQVRAAGPAAPYADPILWGGFAYFGTYAE